MGIGMMDGTPVPLAEVSRGRAYVHSLSLHGKGDVSLVNIYTFYILSSNSGDNSGHAVPITYSAPNSLD